MSNNHLAILAVIVVGLAAVLMSGGEEVAVNQLGDTVVTVASVEADKIAALSIESAAGKSLKLKRIGAQWQLASGHPVDAKTMKALVEELGALKAERRMVNLDDLSPYGLEAGATQTQITVSDTKGQPLATVRLGGAGPDYGSAWTRREGKEEVLLLPEGPVGRLAKDELKPERWMERQPVQFDAADIGAITVTGSVAANATKGAEGDWSGAKADDAKALIERIQNIYVEAPAAKPEAQPLLGVVLAGAANTVDIKLHTADGKWVLELHGLGYSLTKSSAEAIQKAAQTLAGAAAKD